MIINTLAEDLAINKYALDIEWEKQPTLSDKWSEQYAIAVLNRDSAKERLELVTADLFTTIRSDTAAYGVKDTDSATNQAVKKQPQYQEAVENLSQANYVVNRMTGARNAIEHKKRALTSLTELAINDFYNAKGIPPGTIEKHAQNSQNNFTEHMGADAQQKAGKNYHNTRQLY